MTKSAMRSEAHIAVLTQQISNYHLARYHAARDKFSRLTVLSVLNCADFPEFLAAEAGEISVVEVCKGEADYTKAIVGGTLWNRVVGALDLIDPDIVAVAGWSFPESLAAIAWSKTKNRPTIVMSDSQAQDGPRVFWREAIKRRVVSNCDAALVAAERHKNYVVDLGLSSDSVFFGYDAVDNRHFATGADAARADAAALRDLEELPERYLLASGRFITKKNLPLLVAAFAAALERDDRGHHLIILGDGAERGSILTAIEKHRMGERVHLPGFRSYDRLPIYYGLAEGFLHVSLTEQWGLVVNEAAASALPLIVSHPCGAATTLVQEGKNGFIVEPTDKADITAAIGKVMTLSDEQRAEMGKQSRAIVDDWGPERFAEGLANAALAALAVPHRRLGLVDEVLFRAMSRKRISKVS